MSNIATQADLIDDAYHHEAGSLMPQQCELDVMRVDRHVDD